MTEGEAPEVDVVVVVYNSLDLVVDLLRDLARQGGVALRVVLVDNASDPPLRQHLDEAAPDRGLPFRIITNATNVGYGAAANEGMRVGSSPYVLVLNSDLRFPDTDAILHLVEGLALEPRLAIVGGRQTDASGNPGRSHGRFPSVGQQLVSLAHAERVLDYVTARRTGLARGVQVVHYVDGACLCIDRRAIEQVGGFDEGYFLYFEETDLALRLRQRGLGNAIMQDVQIVHPRGGSSGGLARSNHTRLAAVYTASFTRYLNSHLGPISAWLVWWLYRAGLRVDGVLMRVAAAAGRGETREDALWTAALLQASKVGVRATRDAGRG